MMSNYVSVWILITCMAIASTQRVCTDCYGEQHNRAEFLCHGQGCDAFLWPRDKSLPSNLECKVGNDEYNEVCYVFSGLDTTKMYHKFISLNQFDSSRKERMTFTFSE